MASAAVSTSLELDPNQPLVHNNLENIYVQNQQYSLALQTFEEANRLDQSDPNILFNLLRTELRLDRKQSATLHATELLKLSQTGATLVARLGRELAQYELYPQAVVAYERVLELEPDSLEVYIDLYRCYFHGGQFRDSLRVLEGITARISILALARPQYTQDFHFGPGTATVYTRSAPNSTSFHAEPCTSPLLVVARAGSTAHSR